VCRIAMMQRPVGELFVMVRDHGRGAVLSFSKGARGG
jgi:hypothetical protein